MLLTLVLVELHESEAKVRTSVIGADAGFCERGSENRGRFLKQGIWGTQPPRIYKVFHFYSVKIMPNARFKAYSYLFQEIQRT